jgi:hypothetical protein
MDARPPANPERPDLPIFGIFLSVVNHCRVTKAKTWLSRKRVLRRRRGGFSFSALFSDDAEDVLERKVQP